MNTIPGGEEYYQQLFELTPLPMLVYDQETFMFLNANHAAIAWYGYSLEEFQNISLEALLEPVRFVRLRAEIGSLKYESNINEVSRHRRKNGEWGDVEINAFNFEFQGRKGRLVVIRDISQRVKVEGRLRQAESFYRTLFDDLPLPAWVYDWKTLKFLDVNKAAINGYGFSREEFVSMPITAIRTPEESKKLLEHFKNIQTEPEKSKPPVKHWRHQTRQGTEIDVEVDTFPISFGEHNANIVIANNITERRLLERDLKESLRRYREIYETASEGIFIADFQGNLISFNNSVVRFMGYPREELATKTIQDLMPPEDFEYATSILFRGLKNAKDHVIYEAHCLDKSGKRFLVEFSATLVFENGKAIGMQGMGRDVTERKRLEAQLLKIQKLEALGRLAGEVAHSFNNSLTVIQGFATLLKRSGIGNEKQKNYLDNIYQAGEDASRLTSQLLAFSRKQITEPVKLNLNEVLIGMGDMLRVALGETITLEMFLAPEYHLIESDQSQIRQVIMNLVLNARDAMPQGGEIILATKAVCPKNDPNLGKADPGSLYVKFTVLDNGVGMNTQTQRHLFEPFFTTKAEGQGTGLGLFTTYGTVKQSGGFIEVSSQLGNGSKFELYFPVCQADENPAIIPNEASEVLIGSGLILLVEDEPAVRTLVAEILTGSGYQVLIAKNGKEALSILEIEEKKIDLILTDVKMPGMDGVNLAKVVAELNPSINILFMSAYTEEALAIQNEMKSGRQFIQKPFVPDHLLRKVKESLEFSRKSSSN
jgi:two-component system, cell cycle sensor histidine kinase and response regulator CckA